MTAGNLTPLNHHEPLDHEQVRDELPSYLLDDIDPALAAQITAHLDDCPGCADEEARLDAVLGALGTLVPQVAPPPSLRLRMLDQLDEPAAHVVGPAAQEPARAIGRRLRLPALHRPRPRLHQLAWAAGLAALFAFVIIAAVLVHGLQQSEARLAHQRAQAALIQSVMAAPAATVPLIDDGANQPYGALYLAPDGWQAVMAISWLPPTASGELYQIWLVDNGQRTSAGIFRVSEGGTAQLLIDAPRPLSDYQSLGITVEPAPHGSAWPTTARVASCKLPQS